MSRADKPSPSNARRRLFESTSPDGAQPSGPAEDALLVFSSQLAYAIGHDDHYAIRDWVERIPLHGAQVASNGHLEVIDR